MRFPEMDVTKRLFCLFDRLGLRSSLREYTFSDPNTFTLYNNIRRKGDIPSAPEDVFKFGENKGGNVNQDFIDIGATRIVLQAYKTFADEITKNKEAGLKALSRFDEYSVRGYMSDCMKVPQSAIDWCETMYKGNGSYHMSLAQTILYMLPFWKRGVQWYMLE
jgi:hypothetical protein